ncbi:MAG: hypothetical protein ABSG46_02055 [Candidatus Binataceae bacterium]|jgi:hypothetical protein
MSAEFKTGRGVYRLIIAAPPETDGGAITLTLALERADGIERVAFCCRIEGAIKSGESQPGDGVLIELVAPAIEREFEAIREAALKSIRSERKLAAITISTS